MQENGNEIPQFNNHQSSLDMLTQKTSLQAVQREIQEKLAQLNHALDIYEQTGDATTRQQADVAFADLFDWFIERNIPLHFNGLYWERGPGYSLPNLRGILPIRGTSSYLNS